MNHSYFFLKLFCLFFIITSSKCNNYGDSETGSTTEYKKPNASAFFHDYLANRKKTCDSIYPLTLNQIKEEQTAVWEAWKTANQSFHEEKLPSLSPLSQTSHHWNLPAHLEPNAAMPFYWGSKGDHIPPTGYPLYIYIHGSGHKDKEWAIGLQICQYFNDAPSVYFIPQIPNMGDYYRWWQKAKQYAWEKLLRLAFISGKINPNQVYIFGISEGGYGSQRLASFYADYLAGAGPMAGGEPLKNAPVENCRNIAFSMLTGALDNGFYRNKLTQYTKDEFAKLQKNDSDSFIHRIELIPNRGHSIDYTQTTPWLKNYTRNPYPKRVTWENFEMDGLYRTGFYNLYVKERSNTDANTRTHYEMEINENTITLKVDEVTYQTTEKDPHWGIDLKFEKNYKPAQSGRIVIYLCNELIDLSKKVTLIVNGKKVYKGYVKPDLKHIINSCAIFFDPERLYPAALEVDLSTLK